MPTYNEAGNIQTMLAKLLAVGTGFDVLIVDDNSPDGTGKLVDKIALREPRIHHLHREKKQGLGPAYIAGFSWGAAHGYPSIVQMDADFSHDPKDVPRLLERLKQNDVVVGSRYVKGGSIEGWGWKRKFISEGGNIYARLCLGLPYRDLTGGFNAWSAEILNKIDFTSIRAKGYAFQVELKHRTLCAGAKMEEVPIHFENRIVGKSKMTGSIISEAALTILKLRWERGRSPRRQLRLAPHFDRA